MKLPKSEKDKIAVLDRLLYSAENHARVYKVRWLINYLWLMGIRQFYPDYETGQVRARMPNITGTDGSANLLYENAIIKRQAEIGRLMQMDPRPATDKKGFGLTSLRKASAGRVLLDYMTSGVVWDDLKCQFFSTQVDYGLAGLHYTARPDLLGPAGTDAEFSNPEPKVYLEVIPPWQLLPIPHAPRCLEELEGIRRVRWVPLDWLKERAGGLLSLSSDETKMRIREAPYGVKPDSQGMWGGLMGASGEAAADPHSPAVLANIEPFDTRKGGHGHGQTKYAKLDEVWLFQDDKSRLRSYTIKVGEHIALDEPYKDQSMFTPIAVAPYHSVGGFYGRSYLDLLIPLNAAMERMAQNLFQNVEDLDMFGILAVPQTLGIDKRHLLDRRTKRKVVFTQPDPTLGEERIQNIAPANSGDTPGKVLAYAEKMMDLLSNQSELLRGGAPGRVDSQTGLQFLQETSSIPLRMPAGNAANAFTQIYRALLARAPILLQDRKDLPLLGVDDSILGLKINQGSGTVELDPGNYPSPVEIEVNIRDRVPRMASIREQQLLDSLTRQIISPLDFKIAVWTEGLSYPVGSDADRESYRKSVLQVLFLFGDGETPGEAQFSTEADNPDIALLVIGRFMAKPEFTFASARVRQAFKELKAVYQGMIGERWPQQLPPPEALAQMVGQGGGAPGGPPMG